jgi:hypothetical protein
MSKPMIKIHDLLTNEIIEREMNDVEFANWETAIAKEKENLAAEETKAIQKQALFARLGLTADEAKLLLG